MQNPVIMEFWVENDPHIPAQSFETAQKILQKLDKIVSSPKEKSSELKAISMDGSPSNLTLGMPQGQALRSIEGIDSSNFMNSSRNFIVDDGHASLPQSMPHNQDILKNGPLEPGVSLVQLTPESAVSVHAITPATNAKSDSERASGSAISGSAAVPLQEKTAFKISAGSLKMDDDYKVSYGRDKLSKTGFKDTISNTEISDEPFLSTCQSVPVSTTKSFGLFESKTSDGPVGFSFPATPSSSSFNSKAAPPATIFLPKFSDTVGLKSSSELSTSNTFTATQLEDSDLFRDKIRKAGELLKFNTFGSPVSPDFSSSAGSSIFALDAPVNSSLNNGPLNPKLSANFASNASGSGNQMVSIFSTANAAATSPTSSLVSSTAPMFSTANTFQMVASGTACAPSSVSAPFGASGSKDLKAKSTKTLPFTFTRTSFMGTSAISNPGIKDSSLSTSSSTLGTSPSLAYTSSSVFLSTGSGNFSFSFPAQSSGSSIYQSSNQFGVPASPAFGAQANSSSTTLLTSSPSLGFGSSLFAQPATGLSSSSFQSSPSMFAAPAAGNSQFTIGSSSGPAFSFTASTSAFGTGFLLNNQMNTEDIMADDPLQSTAPTFRSFDQPSFPVGSPAIPSLGIQQPMVQFSQPTGNVDLGGSFSLGTASDGKAHRRFVRVKRSKTGKK
ncbi:nuclear pore complex protein Nup214-like isoform X2 [Dioscorea cayenensis subsp. rotundata]|uniref:Nuclear pore complex protein Nup214-like isoform X2 n=1 Tax=Dioscorea cayennensis subsp. rotundata TaxID=55577 RepID=A0AB40CKM4_DIOCR|nr:nuclear pore complex protein Nup214-like isoform X2 [Dioscorea cayenensis subsp. rotundata]